MSQPLLLIVEDIPEMREWVRALIAGRFSQWRLKTAASAVEFHQTIERERPQLVLMDEVLGPGEDLASLLQVANSKSLPVALMTSMAPASPSGPDRPVNLPAKVMRRINKPNWDTGQGSEAFLEEVGQVMALTGSVAIG